MARGRPAQLGRQLDALRLAPRERRRRLPELHVPEAHFGEGAQLGGDPVDRLEDLQRLVHGHRQRLGDGAPGVLHLQRLAVVAQPAALLAGDVDVGQEVHLHAQRAIALAGLAASALDVEAEAPGTVAAHLGGGGHGKEVADRREGVGVGRGVAARCPPDRALVDLDHLVQVLDAGHLPEGARQLLGAVKVPREMLAQDLVDQRALARAGNAGHADEAAQRKRDTDVAQVVGARPLDPQPVRPRLDASCGRADAPPAGHVVGRERAGVGEQPRAIALVDHLAAVAPGAGAEVDDVVGRADHRLVVLDDDDRVAARLKLAQHGDQPRVVARVQADRRLVEHVEHAHEPRADLRGEADALHLAAREGGALAVEGQVVEPHVGEELEPAANLLEYLTGHLPFGLVQLQLPEEGGGGADRPAHDVDDRRAAHGGGARLGPQARALAGGTRLARHVLPQALADLLDLGFGILAAQRG